MNTQSAKLITTLVAAVAAGIPVWTVSFRDLNLLSPSFLALWFLIGMFVTFVATLLSKMKSRDLMGAVTAGFTLAIIIRFLGDMFFGSAQQASLGTNLIVAILVGALSAWSASLIIRLKKTAKASGRR